MEMIKQLAAQAHQETLAVYRERMKTEFAGDVIFSDMYDQRFAELIALECISCVGSQADKLYLRKHFELPTESNILYPDPGLDGSVNTQYRQNYNIL